ncbi:MAG: hypothetical protein EHJ95_01105, partial [Methanobacteriota archaeon]
MDVTPSARRIPEADEHLTLLDQLPRGVPAACVLGTSGTGLGVIRSLGRRGVPVVGLDSNPLSPGLRSRYCTGMVCPASDGQQKEFLDLLARIGERLDGPIVLVPTSDTDVLAVSRQRETLGRYFRFAMPDAPIVEAIVNKRQFAGLLERHGIPHPFTIFPADEADLADSSRLLTYPCILKPAYSPAFTKTFGAKLFVARSKGELLARYRQASAAGQEVVVQEIVAGPDTNLYGYGSYVAAGGRALGGFVYRKVRGYPTGFGLCSMVRSVASEEVSRAGSDLLQAIGYRGLSEVEFKRDERDGQLKVIEVNARTWGENNLAARCGVDLSFIAYQDLLGRAVEPAPPQREGVIWLFLANDLRAAAAAFRQGSLSIREYLASLAGERE